MEPSGYATAITLTPPPELSGSVPRRVQMNDGDARYLLTVVLLFFVGGLIFFGLLCHEDFKQVRQRALLRRYARETTAQVTGFSFSRYSPMSVNYRFTVDGVIYYGKALEPKNPQAGTSFDKGEEILVRFLPSDPATNHPAAWEWSLSIGWWFVVGEAFLTSMGGLALIVLLRDRRLARNGRAASAVVTACSKSDRWFRVDYEFNTENGVLIKGHSDFKDEYGVGARIWVLYLPSKPQRNHSYPLDFYSVLG